MSRAHSYVELHCHSAFSMLDGAALPETLVQRATELGYPALALTDHDELGGAVRFAQAGSELGVAAIIGAELTVGSGEWGVGSASNTTTHFPLPTSHCPLPTAHYPLPTWFFSPRHAKATATSPR